MQAKYDQTVRQQQADIQKEDFSDMVAEHSAKAAKVCIICIVIAGVKQLTCACISEVLLNRKIFICVVLFVVKFANSL